MNRTGSPPIAAAPPQPAIAATAHPLATEAALRMLQRGGTAMDAAIAAQMVLGLVEPHASGIGGGTLILHWDARSRRLRSWDGLSAAPERTTAGLRVDTDGTLLPSDPSQRGGRTVGVPGTVPVFWVAHGQTGRLPWRELFEPAIEAAEKGFPMPAYLHAVLSSPSNAPALKAFSEWYAAPDGRPWPVGTVLRHPGYAVTLRELADKGAPRWLGDGAAQRLAQAAQQGYRPSLMTSQDVQDYRPVEREPVCAPFQAWRVCTAAPPSFGGIAVLQILQMVDARAGGRFDFADPAFVHLYAEAGRLAQADRRQHVGDPDHVRVPAAGLVSQNYTRQRAALIDPQRAMASPAAGRPAGTAGVAWVPDDGPAHAQTSQMAIADAEGNVVSVTTTNNLNFGARLAADGYVLNNAMTNFAAAPRAGEVSANAMAPRKRPVTSMAPTIVFDADGRPVIAGGSAGGGPIVDYVAAALIDMLANGRTPQQAVSRAHVSTAGAKVQFEKDTAAATLAPALAARGHEVEVLTLNSGQAFIRREGTRWIGAADPRRDGVARALPQPASP